MPFGAFGRVGCSNEGRVSGWFRPGVGIVVPVFALFGTKDVKNKISTSFSPDL